MILVDASVLIDYLRSKDPKLDNLFRSLPLAICGVTRAEILAGARGDDDRNRLMKFLGTFRQLLIADSSWDVVGETLSSLYASGVTVPFPDAVIAALAIENRMDIWARDPHFPMMQKSLPLLGLFQEPP
ncbi:MAG TPA: PIN domain-containing protein [Pirellulales bacterium]